MKLNKKTIPELFIKRVNTDQTKNAIGWIQSNKVKNLTFRQYEEKVYTISNALSSIGVNKGSKVCILSQTSVQWHLSDISSLLCGACVVPIYHTYTSEEVEYIFNHSDSEIIFIENNQQFTKLLEVINKLPSLKSIIHYEDIDLKLLESVPSNIETYSFEELPLLGKEYTTKNPEGLKTAMDNVDEEDIASIIYTSGTTGVPKGAVITHKAFTQMLLNIHSRVGHIIQGDRILTFLPLSHVLGRCDSYLVLALGTENVYAESIDKIIDNLALVKPNVMIAVPRIFEKVYSRVIDKIQKSGAVTQKLFEWAKQVSDNYFDKIQKDLAPSAFEILQKKLAYKLVFSKIYKSFGGEVRFFVSGGAPLSPEIITFLRNANLLILEGYGLTETIAPCSLNPLSKQLPGTVGTPLGDVQFGFADDNEILIKTDALFKEYYKNPEATDAAFEGDWFKTGDIGELTPEGYLKITDRKKDIIITSGGKNVAPQKIENLMKTRPYITNFMVIGDQKKYLSGIVSIEKEDFIEHLDEMGLQPNCSIEDIAKTDVAQALIEKEIEYVNKGLARYETIKKFYISPEEFTIENGLVTPSLKLRKKEILKKFTKNIDAMYQ